MRPPLIIGGGPAGAAAAILLARNGRQPVLVERSTGPHDKVCGDFLSAAAMRSVAALGVDLAELAPAAITHVCLVRKETCATARLPFPACGVSRRVLDEALLAEARGAGAKVLRGHAVRRLHRTKRGLVAEGDGFGSIEPEAVFLATGKHELRGAARAARRSTGLVGLKTYVALAPEQFAAIANTVELVLVPGGYVGLQPIEHGRAVLCMLLPAEALRHAGPWPAPLDFVCSESRHLARRLSGARMLLPRPLAIACIPYGYIHRGRDEAGLFRLGDQAAVIPSLTGDGVAIALNSARLAAAVWTHGEPAAAYHRRLARDLILPMTVARLAHRFCRKAGWQAVAADAVRCWPGLLSAVAVLTRAGQPG